MEATPAVRTPIRTALMRGLRRRCPRCGEGALFQRFLKTHERCSECGLLYQRDYGDTLMFMIITDRIPILFGIAFLYFGIHPNGWLSTAFFFGALSVPLLATLRERQGLAIASCASTSATRPMRFTAGGPCPVQCPERSNLERALQYTAAS
jgi:uncharacterized protein (DUF983 family)